LLKIVLAIYFKLLAGLFAFVFCQTLNAQQIIWANKNNIDKRTDFTKVIGQNKYGLYILKHKNSSFRRYFILEHFDKRMNLLKSKTFKIPNAELEKIIVHKKGIVFFSKEFSKGYSYKLTMQSIDSNFNEQPPKTIVSSQNFNDETVGFRIEYNSEKNRFLVWYMLEGEGKTILKYHLITHNQVLKEGQTTISHPLSELYVGDAMLDDTGNLFMIYSQSEKFKSKVAEDFRHYIFCLNIKTNHSTNNRINNPETFVTGYKLSYNQEHNTMSAFGLFGIKDEEENKGYFMIRINCRDFEIIYSVFNDIDRKTVGNIIGLKYEQKGENLSKFKIKKLVPKADGGLLVITERSFVTTQSDIFYVNNIPQSSYAKIFNNDEVLILSLDSAGMPEWTDVVVKNQSSINDGGFYNGIVVMVNDDNFSILYNDRLSANADIIQVTYTHQGIHSKKILLNNEQYYALVIPSEYSQVSNNSIVIPINQNRDYTYIKLLY
jgi:hypothetical protein